MYLENGREVKQHQLDEYAAIKQFLRGLQDVVEKIRAYPEAKRVILPGNTIAKQQQRIERIARQRGVHLPPIVALESRKRPEHYVVGRNSKGKIVAPSGVSIVIEDAALRGVKAKRMKTINPAILLLMVASSGDVPEAEFVARPKDSELAQWCMREKTPYELREPEPPKLSIFQRKR